MGIVKGGDNSHYVVIDPATDDNESKSSAIVVDTTTGEVINTVTEIPEEKQIQQLNLAAFVMEHLPNVLADMSYESLIESYRRMSEIMALRWKVSCSLLAEAYYRVSKTVPHGKLTEVLDSIAGDFGIKRKRLYQKIQLWDTFWQDKEVTDRVQPNGNTWVFEQFPGGETYFVAALSAEDPISAITRAEEQYYSNDENYPASQFRNDLSVETKPESKRIDVIASKLNKTAENIGQLVTEDDDSYNIAQLFSDNMKDMASIIVVSSCEWRRLLDVISSNLTTIKKTIDNLKETIHPSLISSVDKILNHVSDCCYIIESISQHMMEDDNEDTNCK